MVEVANLMEENSQNKVSETYQLSSVKYLNRHWSMLIITDLPLVQQPKLIERNTTNRISKTYPHSTLK